MNATELMLGDWVLMRGTPVQVRAIGVNTIRFSDMLITEPLENIEPIPLTPEILEQNGFVPIRQNAVEPYYWQYFDKKDGSIVNAFRRIYRGLWIECSNATTEASTNKQCEFVHELQHVIKNTEIEMEVVL